MNKYFFVLFFCLFTILGCSQEKKDISENEQEYSAFIKQVYRNYVGVSPEVVMNDCIFDGFVLALIDIDESGNAKYELVYASSDFFKNVFFEPIKGANTSYLDKGKRYLVPFSYKVNRTSYFKEECGQGKIEHTKPFVGESIQDIDYVFKPFEFFWVTPIS